MGRNVVYLLLDNNLQLFKQTNFSVNLFNLVSTCGGNLKSLSTLFTPLNCIYGNGNYNDELNCPLPGTSEYIEMTNLIANRSALIFEIMAHPMFVVFVLFYVYIF